ncbi:uncharacterized protein [Spinacia oleracea]|uniref:Retrotransposon gag domain-containing protein n=1 Tax=Spinacia oleracea TaxID=3562 RepID=A0A9R0K2S2_SPIOL|nr:uncharacterized protein LOC110794971 [Spinacia oleracea]
MAKDDNVNDPPTRTTSTEFHPVLGVNNIKNEIPLTLDRERIQYSNLVELFECHAHAFNIIDHIDPKTPRPTDVSDDMLNRLDSIVKQWICATISYDLMQSFLCRGDSAQQIWNKLRGIFQDNKNSTAVCHDNQFTTLHLNNFADVNAYCTQLKVLADQLTNVDQPELEQN